MNSTGKYTDYGRQSYVLWHSEYHGSRLELLNSRGHN